MAHETPTSRSPRRTLVVWGVVLLVAGLVMSAAGVGIAAARGGGDLLRTFSSDTYATPATLTLNLDDRAYVLYELTGHTRQNGPLETGSYRDPSIGPDDVTVTSPGGQEVTVGTPAFNETLTRGSSVYTAVARFDVSSPGVHVVTVSAPGTEVFVAPSLGSIFGRAAPWLALAGLGVLFLLIGGVVLLVGLIRGATGSSSVAAAPGWYADPHGLARWRWWDGSGWTDHVG